MIHKPVFFSLVFIGHQILGDSIDLQQLIFRRNTLTAVSSLGLLLLQSMVHFRAENISNEVPLLAVQPLLQQSTLGQHVTERLPPSWVGCPRIWAQPLTQEKQKVFSMVQNSFYVQLDRPSAHWGSELFRVVTITLPGCRRPTRWLSHISTEWKPLHISSQWDTRFRTLCWRGEHVTRWHAERWEGSGRACSSITATGWLWSLGMMGTHYCTGWCLGSK